MKLFEKIKTRPIFKQISSLPKVVWVLVVIAFLLGVIIRGSGGGNMTTDPTQEADTSKNQIWTCSMHPQIQLPKPGQCPICFMDLIPLETEDSGDSPTELKMSPTAMKLAEITTARVRRGAAEAEIRLSGKVKVDETRLGKITAWVPGRLEKLYVDYTGTTVKKGDPLVELYSPALYAAQEEMLQSIKLLKKAGTNMVRESARITLEASREKLRQWGLTDKQIREIESRGSAVDRITIQSPMSGVVTHKNALEGLYVNKGTKIYTIADLSQVWVVLDAYESDLPWMRENQMVNFSVEAVPGKIFKGKVVFIDPILNEKTRTIKIRLNADNSGKLLKPGMFVRATVHSVTREKEMPLLVPASAVLKTGKRAVVYVRKPDTEEPVFEGREIQVGARVGDDYIVVSGLKEGEKVVVKGNFKIDSAFQIAAKPSMMNPEGGVAMTGHEHHGQEGTSSSPKMNVSISENEEASGEIEVSETFLKILQKPYRIYFEAQEALAKDDFKAAQEELSNLDIEIMSLSSKDLKGHAQHLWSEYQGSIHKEAQHARHWSNIEAARKAFEGISQTILSLEDKFGHTSQESFYEVFCAMAFNNKGASWMQNHNTVENPYFGSQMLRCGEVKKILKPKSK